MILLPEMKSYVTLMLLVAINKPKDIF